MFNFSLAQEEIIQAQVKYNEASARIEAFRDVEKKIAKSFYRNYLKDENRKENIENIKKSNFVINDERYLCPFYVEDVLASYSVVYSDNMYYTFYYNILGNLVKFDKIVSEDYPIKVYSYSRFGNLISVSFSVDNEEQFVYNEKGKLLAHWQGDYMVKKPAVLKLINIKRGENNND